MHPGTDYSPRSAPFGLSRFYDRVGRKEPVMILAGPRGAVIVVAATGRVVQVCGTAWVAEQFIESEHDEERERIG